CFFDNVAVATTVHGSVHNPEDANGNARCEKALHLEISSSRLVCREPSKNRPTLNQWLRLIAVGRSVGVKPSAPGPIKATCYCDSGDFTDDRRGSQPRASPSGTKRDVTGRTDDVRS